MSIALLGLLAACEPIPVLMGTDIGPEETAAPDAGGDTAPVDTGGDSATSSTADSDSVDTGGTETGAGGTDTAPPVDTGAEVFDCATAPAAPEPATILDGARGYHGLAFTDDGYIVGSDGQALIKADREGAWEVWVPGLNTLEQMAYLPGGDLVVSKVQDGSLERITPEGGRATILSNLSAYGVVIGPDGMIYTAGYSGIHRVDPDTGALESLGTLNNSDTPHSLNFSPDFSRLYLGVIASFGSSLYVLDLDKDLNPVGNFQVFAEDVGGGWHDGVAVDACGTLYVPDYWSSALYRITPAGEVSLYVNWAGDSSKYGHGVVFGNDVGGWRSDALYLPMPYNGRTVQELVIGVPAAGWGGTVINAP